MPCPKHTLPCSAYELSKQHQDQSPTTPLIKLPKYYFLFKLTNVDLSPLHPLCHPFLHSEPCLSCLLRHIEMQDHYVCYHILILDFNAQVFCQPKTLVAHLHFIVCRTQMVLTGGVKRHLQQRS